MSLAFFLSRVLRLTLYAIRNLRAPITVAPARAFILAGPKSGFQCGFCAASRVAPRIRPRECPRGCDDRRGSRRTHIDRPGMPSSRADAFAQRARERDAFVHGRGPERHERDTRRSPPCAGARRGASTCRSARRPSRCRETRLRPRGSSRRDERHHGAVGVAARVDVEHVDAVGARDRRDDGVDHARSRPSLKLGTHSTSFIARNHTRYPRTATSAASDAARSRRSRPPPYRLRHAPTRCRATRRSPGA